jgi:hypothetical protein
MIRGLMWQNFIHIRIESDPSVARDEFRFTKGRDKIDITKEVEVEKED